MPNLEITKSKSTVPGLFGSGNGGSFRKYSAGITLANSRQRANIFEIDEVDVKKADGASNGGGAATNPTDKSEAFEFGDGLKIKGQKSDDPNTALTGGDSNSAEKLQGRQASVGRSGLKKQGNIKREEVSIDGRQLLDDQGTLDSISCFRAFYGLSVFE